MIFVTFQAFLFDNEFTLRERKDIYVLLKILKFCTGNSVKSYQCKFAIHEKDGGENRVEEIEIGVASIKKVLLYRTLRGKFSSVHPELRRLGIVKVEVGETGLHFLRDKGDFHNIIKSPNRKASCLVGKRMSYRALQCIPSPTPFHLSTRTYTPNILIIIHYLN